MTRQIILDTETTGLDPKTGHRIIEIGCVEMMSRSLTGNNFHQYLQPDREIDAEAVEVHGITNEFLQDKPRFAEIADDLIAYLRGAELIIHNAPFDLGFLDHELSLLNSPTSKKTASSKTPPAPAQRTTYQRISDYCSVLDTLVMARDLYPGQRNSLDALCKRHDINNTHRTLHGALLDSEILADVYLAMTGGQVSLSLTGKRRENQNNEDQGGIERITMDTATLPIIHANTQELEAHQERLQAIEKAAGHCLWSSA